MTSLVLQPVRVQAALAGLLGLLATLWCGWWLAVSSGGSNALQRNTLGPRALPKLATGSDQPQMLQRERDGLLAKKLTFEIQANKQTEELNRLSAEAATLQQQLKQAKTMTAKQQSVDAIKKNPPKWDLLKHEKANKPEFDRLIVLWEGSTDAAAEQEAIRILATNQSHWETEASTAMGNAANLRKKQAADLQTMKTTFQAESDKKIASLSYEANIQGMANKILEAVKMLTGGTRASPGENFTNSAGIELVWVPESNFWIGKTEVTGKQYNFVINGAAEGSDEPKDGVSIAIAENYVTRLNDIEAADMQVSLDNKLKPPEFTYALPSVVQWNTAKSQRETLMLSGFETQPFEWTSSKNRDGKFPSFEQPLIPSYRRPIEPNHPVVIDDNGPITLEPTTTSSVSFKGMSKTVTKWSGRLGFRIILIRNQP